MAKSVEREATASDKDLKGKKEGSGRSRSCFNCDFIRSIVSTNKQRLKTGKYNLDLTYITNRIIACGFPAEGFEGLYRNKKSDIVDFLTGHHQSMVKIYNLCAEAKYQYSLDSVKPFSISKFPFLDHNVTNLQKVFTFCMDAALFLQRMEQYHKLTARKVGIEPDSPEHVD